MTPLLLAAYLLVVLLFLIAVAMVVNLAANNIIETYRTAQVFPRARPRAKVKR